MNIFDVLSQGKARLHEPSMSAMLGYLLSPHGDHGLGDTFLRSFLTLCEQSNPSGLFDRVLAQGFINASVELEVPYYHGGKRNDMDIQISLYDGTHQETHRLIIENKIKTGAANPEQLKNYYLAVCQDEENDFLKDQPQLLMVFLTPPIKASMLQAEYGALEGLLTDGHQSCWLHWSDAEEQSKSIASLVQDILRRELLSDINPINEYMRHTLKAFVRHILNTTLPKMTGARVTAGQDLGDIVEECSFQTADGITHRLVRRDSSQIQVYRELPDDPMTEKEIAKPIMRQYIEENRLDIPHENLNTRMIGKRLLEVLREADSPSA